MKRPETPARHRKTTEIRQGEIIDAAMRIIAEQGTRRFTAQALAEEIGVTPGAIFRHFATMDDIIDAVVTRMEALLFAGFPPQAADPIQRLGLFFHRRVQTVVDNPAVSRLLLNDHLSHVGGAACAGKIAGFKRRSRDFVRKALKEAEAKGLLTGVAGVEDGTVLLLGAILALGHTGPRIGDDPGVERFAGRLWTTIEVTLRGTPAREQKTPRTRSGSRGASQKRGK